ncbi:vitamin K epoxide reductase family protein [Flavobacterium sp.]|uniref:vitamin K epoxide reductase family protein n=1 Tax=Flavobacterium sp. TaxID=239 RepID=UPI003D6BD904
MGYDVSFLFSYLKKENIYIDEMDFYHNFCSHKEYPSLLAISDTLSLFGIENLPTGWKIENIKKLPKYFVGLIKDESNSNALQLIKRKKDSFIIEKADSLIKEVSTNEFNDLFQGIILLVEGKKEEIKTANFFVGVIILATYFYLLFQNTEISFLWLIPLISLTGLFFSLQAVSQEIGLKNKISELFCSSSVQNNCHNVINSKKYKFLNKISLPSLALTLFVSQSIAILFFVFFEKMEEFYSLYFIVYFSMLPIIALLFSYQKFILKKFCTVCLILSALIISEFILLYCFSTVKWFSVKTVLLNLFVFFTSYILIQYSKDIFKQYISSKIELQKLNHSKNKYSIFKSFLLESKKIEDLPMEGVLEIGNASSNVKIIIVLSLFCTPCKLLFNKLLELMNSHEERASFQIVFSSNDDLINSRKIIQNLISEYIDFGSVAFKKLLFAWYNDDKSMIYKPTEERQDNTDVIDAQSFWIFKNNINSTPSMIINNYLFPRNYDENDLINFISDLEKDKFNSDNL